MPRFVVLQHDGPRGRHWDFLLETGTVLTAWALAQSPDTPGPIDAKHLADHRIEYLDYEGSVSGERGTVERWDAGTYRFVRQTERQIVVSLEGRLLRGTATLNHHDNDPTHWHFELQGQCARD